jgi:hypothetical protein
MMNDKEFAELLTKLHQLGLDSGDLGYRYWDKVQDDLKELWKNKSSGCIKLLNPETRAAIIEADAIADRHKAHLETDGDIL